MAEEDLNRAQGSEVTNPAQKENKEIDQIRTTIADVYTFVKSREINKTIASFTFDHYIDERKRAIKGERIIRSASKPGEGVDKRLAQLDAIDKLEQDFNKAYDQAKSMAEKASKT